MTVSTNVLRGALAAALLALTSCATSEPSQTRVDAPRGEIITLGTAGGPTLRADRAQAATLLRVGGKLYLIDCGAGVLRQLARANIRSSDIDAVFITHHHPDHNLGLADLMADRLIQTGFGRTQRMLKIYGPSGTREMAAAALQYLDVPLRTFAAEGAGLVDRAAVFDVHDITDHSLIFDDGNIRVESGPTTHYALVPPERLNGQLAFAYRVSTDVGVVLFTGDTGPGPDITMFATGADILVSEVVNLNAFLEWTARNQPPGARLGAEGDRRAHFIERATREHISGPDLGALATQSNVTGVILTHMGPDSSRRTVPETVAQVRSTFSGRVEAASDLQSFCFARRSDGRGALSIC